MNRRRFLSSLGIGAASLMLRFKPEVARELPKVIAFGEYGGMTWTLSTAFRPVLHHDIVPILYKRRIA